VSWHGRENTPLSASRFGLRMQLPCWDWECTWTNTCEAGVREAGGGGVRMGLGTREWGVRATRGGGVHVAVGYPQSICG
jgi:hypothetical protein